MVNQQKLIEDNMNLVYYVIHQNFPKYATDEDIVQVGMLGLCKAANVWDEDKGIFSSFAVKSIYYEICNEFRCRNKHKFTYSLDYTYSDSEDESVTLGDMLVGDSDIDWVDTNELYNPLTEQERAIVEMKQMGLSKGEISERLGISQQRVRKHLRQAKLRLEKNE